MSKSIYTHYVYRITNVLLNKHYYGSRSCKCQPNDDLGIKYFSSSRDKGFIKDQKDHPEHYRYKIIKIYETRKDALELEVLLHNKFDVVINDHFYNRSKQTSSKFYYHNKGEKHPTYGKPLSEDHRKKIGEANKGKQRSEETRKKLSEAHKGEKNPQFKGYYITPFGEFATSVDQQIKENNIDRTTLRKWCKTNNTIITKNSYVQSKYLQENFDESIIGKTYKDIGFSFEYVT
jgi:hypothetical protein